MGHCICLKGDSAASNGRHALILTHPRCVSVFLSVSHGYQREDPLGHRCSQAIFNYFGGIVFPQYLKANPFLTTNTAVGHSVSVKTSLFYSLGEPVRNTVAL